jgi:hypothetical protein
MSALPNNILKMTFSECIVCSKPLGQDSKDSGFRTCHAHRACTKCGDPLQAREIQWCHDRLIEDNLPIEALQLIHARCEIASRQITQDQDATLSIKQSEYDLLNISRLMTWPDVNLNDTTNENNAYIQSQRLISGMSFDQITQHLKMLEACVASVSIALRTSKDYRKDAFKERDEASKKRADKEKLTSSRPTKNVVDDPQELALGTFMELHGLTERKVAMQIQRDYEKSIKGFMAVGVKELDARKLVIDTMVKQGRLPK